MGDVTQPISERLADVRARIAAAAFRVGRDPAGVHLVAVTKNHPAAAVQAVIDAGARDIGENRVQEALGKFSELGLVPSASVKLHLIGHLQTNKAGLAVRHFDLVHSVDSSRLARELDRAAVAVGSLCDILVEVNVSGEDSKFGLSPDGVWPLLQAVAANCPSLRVKGFMTMAPFVDDPEAARPWFRRMKELAGELRVRAGGAGIELGTELSMGMTNDYEVAVEEGATIVRVGTAIFGARA